MNHPALSGWPKGRHCRNPLWKRILSAPADSELCFCMPEIFPAYQKRPPIFGGLGLTPKSWNQKRKNTMANGKPGRPKEVDPKIHRYNFKLTSEQNTRFRQMSKRPDAPATYLISSSPGSSDENSASLKSDPSAARYVARLNDFYWQFSRIGNNYNQIVKQVNTHFSEKTIPVQLSMLVSYTRQLKALSEQIASLSKELHENGCQNKPRPPGIGRAFLQ